MKRWTAAEDAIVRDHYREGIDVCIALLSGRSFGAVSGRASVLGLTKARERWTAADDAALLAMVKAGPITVMPGRTRLACRYRALRLGVSRREIVRAQTTADASAWNQFLGVRHASA